MRPLQDRAQPICHPPFSLFANLLLQQEDGLFTEGVTVTCSAISSIADAMPDGQKPVIMEKIGP